MSKEQQTQGEQAQYSQSRNEKLWPRGDDEHMSQHHSVTIDINDQCAIDAGNWQECVEKDQTPYRLVSPPHTSMYRQVLLYLEEATRKEIELGLVKRLIIGYQDRFVRFGCDWFEHFCERHGTGITVMNGETFSPEEELVRDLIAIVTVLSARLHGLRSHKHLIREAALGKDIQDDQGT